MGKMQVCGLVVYPVCLHEVCVTFLSLEEVYVYDMIVVKPCWDTKKIRIRGVIYLYSDRDLNLLSSIIVVD